MRHVGFFLPEGGIADWMRLAVQAPVTSHNHLNAPKQPTAWKQPILKSDFHPLIRIKRIATPQCSDCQACLPLYREEHLPSTPMDWGIGYWASLGISGHDIHDGQFHTPLDISIQR